MEDDLEILDDPSNYQHMTGCFPPFRGDVPCPRCGSPFVKAKNYAKRTGAAIGTTVGGVAGYTGAVGGGAIGAKYAIQIAGNAHPLTAVAAAVLGALAGAVTGGMTGAALGELIDEKVLNNYQCLSCHYMFQR